MLINFRTGPVVAKVRSTVSSMIWRARQHLLVQSKKPLDFVSSRGLSKPNRENFSRTISVSSFLLPFSLLASVSSWTIFPRHRYSGPIATDDYQHLASASSLTQDIAVSL